MNHGLNEPDYNHLKQLFPLVRLMKFLTGEHEQNPNLESGLHKIIVNFRLLPALKIDVLK